MNQDKAEHERLQQAALGEQPSDADGLTLGKRERAEWEAHKGRYAKLWKAGEKASAELAAEAGANSLRARCAKLVLTELAGKTPYNTPVGSLPDPHDRAHFFGDHFAPRPPGAEPNDHWSVLQEWAAEEALAETLHAGGAFAVVVRAARELGARRLLKRLEELDCRLRAEGDQLWIGPRSKVPADALALGKVLKAELLAHVTREAADATAPGQGDRGDQDTPPDGD